MPRAEIKSRVLKVAIIGCGKIADSHAAQVQRVKDCEIVGVCDREELLAQQLADRFRVNRWFTDAARLLDECCPDVVHVATPPQSHCSLGKQCLDAGCHVYIEKPFTIDTAEADELIAFATAKGRLLTAGHNAQFTPAARRMRQLIHDGYLGGEPVHMESTWCYDLGDQNYAKAVLGDKQHWLRRMPGKLLQNIISHGVARIAEFLSSDSPEVTVRGFVSPMLKRIGEHEITDELRAIIVDRDRTAYFTFSSQMRPSQHDFRIFGPRNGLVLDDDQQTVIKLSGSRHKSYAEHFIPPLSMAKQYAANWWHNAGLFLRNDFHHDSSKKHFFELFYDAIRGNLPPPLPYREIRLTSWIMDEIFRKLGQPS